MANFVSKNVSGRPILYVSSLWFLDLNRYIKSSVYDMKVEVKLFREGSNGSLQGEKAEREEYEKNMCTAICTQHTHTNTHDYKLACMFLW